MIFFTALAPGASGLNLSNVALLDASGKPINFSISNGSINVTPVTPVPEPATISLLLLGVAPFAVRRLRASGDALRSARTQRQQTCSLLAR